mgnify:CR=1 FL=1
MEQNNLELEFLEDVLSNIQYKPKLKKKTIKTPLITAKSFNPGFDSI